VRNQIKDWSNDKQMVNAACLVFDDELLDHIVNGSLIPDRRIVAAVDIWPSKTHMSRCRMGSTWMHFSQWCIPVDPRLTKLQSLFSKEGFMRAMLSSRYFGMPFLPNCSRLMYSIYASIVFSYEPFSLPKSCQQHISRDSMLMLVLRILTWLGRDEQTLLLLS